MVNNGTNEYSVAVVVLVFILSHMEIKGNSVVDCSLDVTGVGAREDEKAMIIRIVGVKGAGGDKL